MSHSHLITTSSSNFQLIVENALKVYEERTRKDVLTLPLFAQLQACNSPDAIIAVLQEQVQGPSQSLSEERLIRWLNPTVHVLYSLSSTLGEGFGRVSLRT
jgi:hypothetical protein